LAAPTAWAQCEYPPAVDIPDGTSATKDDMTDARIAVEKYMKDMEGYLECLDQESATLPEEERTPEQRSMHAKRHNAAVDAMEAVAARFNEQVRAFKKAN